MAASEAGVGLEVDCTYIAVADSGDAFSWVDATANTTCDYQGHGIHKLVIDLDAAGMDAAHLFQIEVMHSDVEPHFGGAVFDRRHSKNSSMGQ